MYTFHEHEPDTVLRRMEAYRMLRNAADHVERFPVLPVPDAQARAMFMIRAIDIRDSLDFQWHVYREMAR